MTLDEMIQETSTYVQEEIGTAPYSGDSLIIVNMFISAINYAYSKIARERWKPSYVESVTLDTDKRFDVTDLTKTFNSIKEIKDSDGFKVFWKLVDDAEIECSNSDASEVMTVEYYYLPTQFSALTSVTATQTTELAKTTVLPDTVDDKILCFYAAYKYLLINGDENAVSWLNLFNDGFDNISQNRGAAKTIKNRMWS